MRNIIETIKGYIRKMSIYVVTAYANRIYKKAVLAAEQRHEKEKEMIYVANGAINASVLRTYNRKEFRKMKRILKIGDNKSYNLTNLKSSAWYHTANRDEKEALTPKAKELRRKAFVKTILKNAKLV
jgi:hypothetical protein